MEIDFKVVFSSCVVKESNVWLNELVHVVCMCVHASLCVYECVYMCWCVYMCVYVH